MDLNRRVSASTNRPARSAGATGTLPAVTTISESRPLAATPHTCTVCGRAILPGTRYSRILLRRDDVLDPRRALTVVKWHLPYCPGAER